MTTRTPRILVALPTAAIAAALILTPSIATASVPAAGPSVPTTAQPAPAPGANGIIMRDGGVCDPIRHMGC